MIAVATLAAGDALEVLILAILVVAIALAIFAQYRAAWRSALAWAVIIVTIYLLLLRLGYV